MTRASPGDAEQRARSGAWSGYAVVALGAAGAAFERGASSAGTSAAEAGPCVAQHRGSLLVQTLFFTLSDALFLWFVGSLRGHLLAHDERTGWLSTVVFGSGSVWAGLPMSLQAAMSEGVRLLEVAAVMWSRSRSRDDASA